MRHLRLPRDERGAAAVEFALVLVPLLLLLFGIIDFARAFHAQQAVSAAAREGVRVLALGDTADVTSRAQAAAAPLPPADVTVTITQACVIGQPGAVRVSYPFEFVTPLPALIPGFGGGLTLTGRGEMRCGG